MNSRENSVVKAIKTIVGDSSSTAQIRRLTDAFDRFAQTCLMTTLYCQQARTE
jgi:RecA-family ATPase